MNDKRFGRVPRNRLGNIRMPQTIDDFYVAEVTRWDIKLKNGERWRLQGDNATDVIVHFHDFVSVGGSKHNSARVRMDEHGYYITRNAGKHLHRFGAGPTRRIAELHTVSVCDKEQWAAYVAGLGDEWAAAEARKEAEQHLVAWNLFYERGGTLPDVITHDEVESIEVRRPKMNKVRMAENEMTNCLLALKPGVLPYHQPRRFVCVGEDWRAYIRHMANKVYLSDELSAECLFTATELYAHDKEKG